MNLTDCINICKRLEAANQPFFVLNWIKHRFSLWVSLSEIWKEWKILKGMIKLLNSELVILSFLSIAYLLVFTAAVFPCFLVFSPVFFPEYKVYPVWRIYHDLWYDMITLFSVGKNNYSNHHLQCMPIKFEIFQSSLFILWKEQVVLDINKANDLVFVITQDEINVCKSQRSELPINLTERLYQN